MAEVKTPAKPVNAPALAPSTPPVVAAKPKKERTVYKSQFATEAEAVKEAGERTKGPRRAFTCKLGDKTFYIVHNNEGRAAGEAFTALGGTVTENGKAPNAKKPVTMDAVLASVNALPEAERAKILEALKNLK